MNELLVEPDACFIPGEERKNKFLGFFMDDPKLKVWELTENDFETFPKDASNFEIFIFILTIYKNRIKPGASIILFKAERLIHLFDNLIPLALTSNIYFLSIIRDCRGVYASQKGTKFTDSNKSMSQNPVETAINWKIHVQKAFRLKKVMKIQLIKPSFLVLDLRGSIISTTGLR